MQSVCHLLVGREAHRKDEPEPKKLASGAVGGNGSDGGVQGENVPLSVPICRVLTSRTDVMFHMLKKSI